MSAELSVEDLASVARFGGRMGDRGWRAQLALMASSKVGTRGFLHGTWTLDGHVMQVFADEQDARRYHDAMIAQGSVERPGVQCIVWDVAEVGAESSAPGSA